MKVFLSTDIEGTAGIVDWSQCTGTGAEADAGRRLLLAEVNAAIEGALAAGADEIVVNDSHSTMRNLPPAELAGEASYISGQHKPMYMMEGLDASYDAILLISYHGSVGVQSGLSHSYSPKAILEARINGIITGEAGINALVAAHYGVPIVLITGDSRACAEARDLVPDVRVAVVKEPITRMAAHGLHPKKACALIRAEAEQAVAASGKIAVPSFGSAPEFEILMRTSDLAEAASWVRGVERTGERTVRFTGSDPLAQFQSFSRAVLLTRSVALLD